MAGRELFWRANIQQVRFLLEHVLNVDLRMIVANEPGRHEAGHVDGILGRTELRRIGEFHFFQVEDRHAGLNGDGEHIDSFIDACAADCLRAEHFAGMRIEYDLERHSFGAGKVADMVARMDVDLSIRPIDSLQRFFRCAGKRGRAIEHANDRRALRAAEVAMVGRRCCRPRCGLGDWRGRRAEPASVRR